MFQNRKKLFSTKRLDNFHMRKNRSRYMKIKDGVDICQGAKNSLGG